MSVKKKIIICGIILFAVLVIINVAWFVGVWSKYAYCLDNVRQKMEAQGGIPEKHTDIYVEGEEGTDVDNSYIGEKYCITIREPSYLNFNSGFIGVSNARFFIIRQLADGTSVANRQYDVGIYIWPQFSGEYKIGVRILEGCEDIEKRYYVDKDLNYIPDSDIDEEYNKEVQETIDKYYDDLKEMLDFAVDILEIEL